MFSATIYKSCCGAFRIFSAKIFYGTFNCVLGLVTVVYTHAGPMLYLSIPKIWNYISLYLYLKFDLPILVNRIITWYLASLVCEYVHSCLPNACRAMGCLLQGCWPKPWLRCSGTLLSLGCMWENEFFCFDDQMMVQQCNLFFALVTKLSLKLWFRSLLCSICLVCVVFFLAATKQLYEWFCPSVRLSVCHTFFTMFPSS